MLKMLFGTELCKKKKAIFSSSFFYKRQGDFFASAIFRYAGRWSCLNLAFGITIRIYAAGHSIKSV